MAYTKDGIVRIFHSVHQKEKPPRSCDLPGGFFAPSGMPKPLPLGEVSPKVTERASLAGKSLCAAISRLFVRAILSQCKSCLAASLPSQALRASSPKGGALGRPGHFLLPARGPTGRKRAGLATEGSGFWTSAPCQAAVNPDSGALPFPRHRALLVPRGPDRHASGSPFGGAGERMRD